MRTKKGPWERYQEFRKRNISPESEPDTTTVDPPRSIIMFNKLCKKIKQWNWKWITMAGIALTGVIITGVVAHHQMTNKKTDHSKISWYYDYPEKSYPNMTVRRKGYIKIKEGSHDKKLLFHTGTCEVYDNGQKLTVQASIREDAKYENEIGLPVEDKCSSAEYRHHIFKCCWVD